MSMLSSALGVQEPGGLGAELEAALGGLPGGAVHLPPQPLARPPGALMLLLTLLLLQLPYS